MKAKYIMKGSIKTKFLSVCIILILLTTVTLSLAYFRLTKQDKQRASQQRMQIAFDIVMDDLSGQFTQYRQKIEEFLSANAQFTMAVQMQSQRRMRMGDFLAKQLRTLATLTAADRLILYGEKGELLDVFYKPGLTRTEPGPMKESALSESVTAEFAQLGDNMVLRVSAPVMQGGRLAGVIVLDGLLTQALVERYAGLSKTDVNVMAEASYSVGTLPAYTQIEADVLATLDSCGILLTQQQDIPVSFASIEKHSYYQGQCAFTQADQPIGALSIHLSREVELQEMRRILTTVVSIAVVVILASVILVSFIFVPTLTRPIITLTRASRAIAGGNLEQAIDTRGKDELGVLARGFAQMRDEVKRRIQELQQLNDELEDRVKQRTAEITRQKYILDTFMANIPDSIYFKDRESRFIRSNRALAKLLGLSDPSVLVGKTDFDFFPEDQARPKFEQEQEIIRSGHPILAFEEPDAENHWALTTKMPLRDEHGAIIGTFGMSRDITELKQTQQGLEDAYAEINVLNEQLKDENLRMSAEMELAQRIQTSLLPRDFRDIHPDFEIAATMLPADEVGGDYYDIAYDLEHNLWLSIGDVSGHGVTPGLIMMMAQTIHSAITTNYHVSPKEVMIDLNKALYHNVSDRLAAKHFMTFTSLKYLGHGRFQHAGAHLDLIIYRQRTQQCELIETAGTFLNFIPDISHATANAEFSLDVGDLMVLYTDGLTEAFNRNREILDIQRFQEIIRRHAHENVEALKDVVFQEVLNWCDGKRADDMSFIAIRRVQ